MYLVGSKNIDIMSFDYTVSYNIYNTPRIDQNLKMLKMQSMYYIKYWLATIIICTHMWMTLVLLMLWVKGK